MLDLQTIQKKYSLYFPNLPSLNCEKKENTFIVYIFESELIIHDIIELDKFLNIIIDCVYKKEIHNDSKNIKQNDKTPICNNKNEKKIKKDSVEQKSLYLNCSNKKKFDLKSTKSKMKIKNLQNNKYVPNFVEDNTETRNNILIENKRSFSDNINKYCSDMGISYPEFLFEKSNGVFICRAMFMNEKFESRYAYDINVAKEDACSLIWAFLNYKDENNNS